MCIARQSIPTSRSIPWIPPADGSGTDLDYVFIDGVGQPSDFEGIDVTGKVVFCSRGTTSFFEKAEAAVAAGAIATIIYNNEPGVINLDLSDYTKTEPCISITQDAGKYIRENSVDAGGYFTGKITVSKRRRSSTMILRRSPSASSALGASPVI